MIIGLFCELAENIVYKLSGIIGFNLVIIDMKHWPV